VKLPSEELSRMFPRGWGNLTKKLINIMFQQYHDKDSYEWVHSISPSVDQYFLQHDAKSYKYDNDHDKFL
jgi:hypothetical protein